MNEKCDRKTITLWGESSNIDNELLRKLSVQNFIVAFCDVKTTLYQGNLGLGSTSITTMWINPAFEKAKSLQEWSLFEKKKHPNITLLPSLQINTAKTLTIAYIAGRLFDNELKYCKFNATIKTIRNLDDPYYASCTKCYKKIERSDLKYPYCLMKISGYEERFLLKLDVFAKTADSTEIDRCTVTLFEAARYLIGCDVSSYIQSISEKNEESPFYHTFMLSAKKEYTFLARLDAKYARNQAARRFIAEEVHKVKNPIVVDVLDEETKLENAIKKTQKDRVHEDATEDPIAPKRVKLEKNL
ncbi:putative protein isoform X1 [Capsicum galapagoense]